MRQTNEEKQPQSRMLESLKQSSLRAAGAFIISTIPILSKNEITHTNSSLRAIISFSFPTAPWLSTNYENPLVIGATVLVTSLVGCWRIKRAPSVAANISTGLCLVMYFACDLPIQDPYTKAAVCIGTELAYIIGSTCYLQSKRGGGFGIWTTRESFITLENQRSEY